MLIALLSVLLAQSPVPSAKGPIFSQPSSMNRYAASEFAPASGAGMGTACACAAITGAKGEALTFTRTGNATCSKQGLATTGIANGDLVACTANQPRVESSGGVLGLRVEGARTNSTLRSQEIDNAAWAKFGVGVAAPTVTADFATAPDGTATADRVQFSACPLTTDASGLEQVISVPTSPSSMAVYLRANAGTPSVSLCTYGSTGGSRSCTSVALTTASWTLAKYENQTHTGNLSIEIGCENRTAVFTGGGASNTGAADVLVWGVQTENNSAYATSYIPTVAAAVTRNAEAPYLTMPVTVSPRSWAATSTVPFALANVNNLLMDVRSGVGATDFVELFHRLGTAYFGTYAIVSSSPQQVNGTVALGVPGTNRAASWYAPAGTLNVISNGTTESAATALGALPALDRVYIGTYVTTGAELNGIVSRVCVDPDPSRCR